MQQHVLVADHETVGGIGEDTDGGIFWQHDKETRERLKKTSCRELCLEVEERRHGSTISHSKNKMCQIDFGWSSALSVELHLRDGRTDSPSVRPSVS